MWNVRDERDEHGYGHGHGVGLPTRIQEFKIYIDFTVSLPGTGVPSPSPVGWRLAVLETDQEN